MNASRVLDDRNEEYFYQYPTANNESFYVLLRNSTKRSIALRDDVKDWRVRL